MNNRIPRNFYSIKFEMLIDTSETKKSDVILVSKNNYGYLAYNKRTNRHFYTFVSMLRNENVCKILEVVQ